jgi:2-octaprenyl-6-methoxyphenol hydroxylase
MQPRVTVNNFADQFAGQCAEQYDVAIVGGGLVGASLACALAPLGLKLCLMEAVIPSASDQPSYDDRTLALSASSCRILQGLDLWPQLKEQATAIREIQVRELQHPGSVLLDAQELGLESFGHVVEAREFGAAVLRRLEELKPGLSLICPARVNSLQTHADHVQIAYTTGDQEKTLRARLVVGADGAESRIRAEAGIETERFDYGQTAIICNVTPEEPHRGRAFESFTPTGPFALLPHRDGRCGLVWSVPSDQAEALLALDDAEFLHQAERRFGKALGAWKKIGRRSSYPLQLVRAKADWQPRVLILGNAAHAIHPIAAQGFNLGLRDVAVLAEVLANALADARLQSAAVFDPGSTRVLQTYSAWRKDDQAETIAYTDGLARLYANPSVAASIARRAGLLAHRLVPALRRHLAIKAMGFRGRIPKLAQGERLGERPGDVLDGTQTL